MLALIMPLSLVTILTAIAITSAVNFEISGNELFGNVSFIGSRGPNCSTEDTTPVPTPFVIDRNNTREVDVQKDFQAIPDGDALTCIMPPADGDYWPYRGGPPSSTGGDQGLQGGGGGGSAGRTAGLVVGILCGIGLAALAAWFIRRWALRRRAATGGMTRSDTRQHFLDKEAR